MKKMKIFSSLKIIIFFVLLVELCGLVQPDAIAQIRSGVGYLKILPGARQQALSGTVAGLVDETYAFYANPAATGFLREWQWTLTYTNWIADIYNMSLNYGQKIRLSWLPEAHTILGINYLGVRQFDSSKGAAPPASASDLLLVAGMGFPVNSIAHNLSVGANIKYFHSSLDRFSAGAWMADFGVLWRTRRFRFDSDKKGLFRYGFFSAGASIAQLGQPIQYIAQKTPLPLTFRGGLAFYAGSHNGLQVQMAVDYVKVKDEVGAIALGGELSLGQMVAIRAGYNFKNHLLSKFTFGMGIRLDDYRSPLRNFLPGRKHALKIDLAGLQNQEFFSNAYRGSITDLPIGPEYFELLGSDKRIYTAKDSILLQWERTKDPDLFDHIREGIYVTSNQDSINHFVQRVKNGSFPFVPSKNDAVLVAFADSAVIHRKSQTNHLYVKVPPQEPGEYYWTAWAVDEDGHAQLAQSPTGPIAHFRVLPVSSPPDTAADLHLAKKQKVPPLRLDIHFAFDSAQLEPESQELLNVLGSALNSREFLPYDLKLGGHTDQRGSDAYNLRLSQRRVNSVKDYLIAVPHVDSSRITAIGYGESRPIIAHPKNEAEYAVNRRVEMELLNPVHPRNPQAIQKNSRPTPKTLLAGSSVEYLLIVTNGKRNPARQVKLRDRLPAGFTLLSATPKPDTIIQKSMYWQWPALQPGEKDTVFLKAKTPDFVETNPKRFLNWAQVSAVNDTNWHNDLDSVEVFVLGTPDTTLYWDSLNQPLSAKGRSTLTSWAKFVRTSPNVPLCIEGFVEPGDSASYKTMSKKLEWIRNWIKRWIVENSDLAPTQLHLAIRVHQKKMLPNRKPVWIHPSSCKK